MDKEWRGFSDTDIRKVKGEVDNSASPDGAASNQRHKTHYDLEHHNQSLTGDTPLAPATDNTAKQNSPADRPTAELEMRERLACH